MGTPLPLRVTPVPLTCGLFNGKVVVDPDKEEEQFLQASLTIFYDAAGQNILGKEAN